MLALTLCVVFGVTVAVRLGIRAADWMASEMLGDVWGS